MGIVKDSVYIVIDNNGLDCICSRPSEAKERKEYLTKEYYLEDYEVRLLRCPARLAGDVEQTLMFNFYVDDADPAGKLIQSAINRINFLLEQEKLMEGNV